MTRLTEHGRRIRRNLVGAVGLVVVMVLSVLIGVLLRPSVAVDGPAGDSTVTVDRGASALARLLDARGLDVQRSGAPFDDLNRLSTVVLLEPGLFSDALNLRGGELITHLDRGGMVVLGGNVPDGFIAELSGRPYRTVATDRSTAPLVDARFGGGVLMGEGSRRASVDVGDWMLVAGDADQALVVATEVRGGVLVAVPDLGPFTNALIDSEDNAAFLASLLSRHPTVVFDDLVHGYRQGSDPSAGWLRSAPDPVRRAAQLLALAACIGLIAYARRTGPPEDLQRRLPPARSEHIAAVAATLDRGNATADAASVIRREVLHRLGLDPTDPPDVVAAAATARGLDSGLIRAMLADEMPDVGVSGGETAIGSRPDDVLLALDHALAALLDSERPPKEGDAPT